LEESKFENNQKKLIDFIENVIEPPNEKFANFPVCPFAKKERLNNEIFFKEFEFSIKPSSELIDYILESFIQKVDYTLMLFDPSCSKELQVFRDYGKSICELLKDEKIVAVAMHPSDTFNIDGYYTRQAPFHTILVQLASEIMKGRKILEKTDYYKNWKESDKEIIEDQFGKYLS
jgi:hypothetical protein